MIGVLIVSHGQLAVGLLDAVKVIMGAPTQTATLALNQGDSIERLRAQILQQIQLLNDGAGVIIVTDLYAASPYSQTIANHTELANLKIPYKIFTGANLSMLIEIFHQRLLHINLDEMTSKILQAGKNGVREFFTELRHYPAERRKSND